MKPLRERLEALRDEEAEAYKDYQIDEGEEKAFIAGFDKAIPIICELVEAMKQETKGCDQDCDCDCCIAIRSLEAKLRARRSE